MSHILKIMDYVVDGILEAWSNIKEGALEFAELGLAIINALFVCVFLLTIPVWILPYLIYRRRVKKEVI